jgi:hypothetical protein
MTTNTHSSRRGRLALAAAFVATLVAASLAAQSNSPMVRYTATATNLDPTVRLTATLVDITVNRWSTDSERQRLMGILVESGQDKLLKALQEMPRVGNIKTPDSLAYAIQYARRIPADDGGERVVLVTDRPISFWETANQSRTLQYPFMVIELRLDSRGRGEGRMTVATKLDVDRDGQIILENYGSQPVRLGSVKREDKQGQGVR